jgi:hypothetical protein
MNIKNHLRKHGIKLMCMRMVVRDDEGTSSPDPVLASGDAASPGHSVTSPKVLPIVVIPIVPSAHCILKSLVKHYTF